MRQFFIFLIAFFALASCGKKESEKDFVGKGMAGVDTMQVLANSLMQCSRIYTTEWNVHKIVHFSDSVSSFLGIKFKSFGDRKFIVPIDVTVKSYVDMSAVSERNIHIDSSGVVTVLLPKPKIEITGTRIDWESAKTYVSFYRSSFTEKEKADLLYQGEKSIRNEVRNLDLDAMAKHTASHAITPLIKQLGFQEHKIHIIFEGERSKE